MANNTITAAAKKTVRRAKATLKLARTKTLDDIAARIKVAKCNNNNKIPRNFVSSIVNELEPVCSWINRDVINYHYRTWSKRSNVNLDPPNPTPVNQDEIAMENAIPVSSDDSATSISNHIEILEEEAVRKKGGRPKGTTDINRKLLSDSILAAKNEITDLYAIAKSNAGANKVEKNTLQTIINQIVKKRKLPNEVSINIDTIRRRVSRKSHFVTQTGVSTPLACLEEIIVTIVIQMARIRQCLSPSKGLRLVNSVIAGTDAQADLIKWKTRHCSNSLGTVGKGYWRGFMKRHGHKVVSKRGAKYALNRAEWSTYHNFDDMYRHIYEEMELSGVAKRRDEPVWMDRDGNIVEEVNAHGCKVTHDFIRPDMCLVRDEVGGNINMTGDGHQGGQLLLCPKGTIPQQKISTRDKHFTLMGLTLLSGDPVMCILIIAGKKPSALVELGINNDATMVGKEGDEDFFENNCGKDKLFPGGPTCEVRGKTVPCFIRWNEKGGMTSTIFKEALEQLDFLEVFPRANGMKPVLLVDGHGSRFGLDFLEYINDPAHIWTVCIGVPYGTALWQVGDSKEQNGSYNIAITKAKDELLQEKDKKCMRAELQTYDIIPLVNKAWDKSFARTNKNKTAISDRGWNPLNRNILTFPDIRATMTTQEMEEENTSSDVTLRFKSQSVTDLTTDSPSFESKYLIPTLPKPDLNLDAGEGSLCIDSLVRHEDLMKAKARIRKEQDDGKTLLQKIEVSKRMTASMLTKNGTHTIGKDILTVVKQHH